MIQQKTNWPEVIARLMMILVGFIVAMLGVITAIHSEHHVLGLSPLNHFWCCLSYLLSRSF